MPLVENIPEHDKSVCKCSGFFPHVFNGPLAVSVCVNVYLSMCLCVFSHQSGGQSLSRNTASIWAPGGSHPAVQQAAVQTRWDHTHIHTHSEVLRQNIYDTISDAFCSGNNPNLWEIKTRKTGTKDGNETRLDRTIGSYSFHQSSATDHNSSRTFFMLLLLHYELQQFSEKINITI